jgi:hypothetical protein
MLAQIESLEGQWIMSVLEKAKQLTVGAAKPTDQALPRYAPTLEEIQERAHEIYVQRGRIDGFDLADWFQAEEELNGVSTGT